MRKKFFNIELDLLTTIDALKTIQDYLNSDKNYINCFINAHCFNIAQKNSEYKKSLESFDLILNDGIGIKLASHLIRLDLMENLNGTDLIPKIITLASQLKKRIYLLGGKPGIAELACKNIEKAIPGVVIAGFHDGYFTDNQKIVEEINSSGADLLIVGMGVPKQEIWLSQNKKSLNTKLSIAGGAIIDFQAGNVMRAPLWMQKVYLEWLFRLLQEPKRLWKRYLIGNLVFFYNILKLKFSAKP